MFFLDRDYRVKYLSFVIFYTVLKIDVVMSHSPTWNFITAISFCTNRLGNDNLRWRTNPEVFLYKSSFLCYFIILIFHAVWDIVTSRGYTC